MKDKTKEINMVRLSSPLAQLVADCERLVRKVELAIKTNEDSLGVMINIPKYMVEFSLNEAKKQGY